VTLRTDAEQRASRAHYYTRLESQRLSCTGLRGGSSRFRAFWDERRGTPPPPSRDRFRNQKNPLFATRGPGDRLVLALLNSGPCSPQETPARLGTRESFHGYPSTPVSAPDRHPVRRRVPRSRPGWPCLRRRRIEARVFEAVLADRLSRSNRRRKRKPVPAARSSWCESRIEEAGAAVRPDRRRSPWGFPAQAAAWTPQSVAGAAAGSRSRC